MQNKDTKIFRKTLKGMENSHKATIDLSLDRILEVFKRLFRKKFSFKIIVVGGTNGKGSTVSLLENIYKVSKHKVGTFTSPHIFSFNERIRINGKNVSNHSIIKSLKKIDSVRGDITLTFFEYNTLIALLLFDSFKVDVAILEVGLGGRLDAVNILQSDLSIITSIDKDHESILGNTRDKIAIEKAGIMRRGKVSICGEQNPPRSLIAEAKKIGSKIEFVNNQYSGKIKLEGQHQRINAEIAKRAVEHLKKDLYISSSQIKFGISKTEITGRQQILEFNGKQFVIDVAHNPAAVKKLLETLNKFDGKFTAIFSALRDKDVKNMIKIIHHKIEKWLLVPIEESRGMSSQDLQKIFPKNIDISLYSSTREAIEDSMSSKAKNILVFGSFYTVSYALRELEILKT